MKTIKSFDFSGWFPVDFKPSSAGLNLKKCLSISVASVLALSASGTVNGQFSVTASVGGLPSANGVTLEGFNGSSPAILALSGSAYLVTGADYGVAYIPPCFSGSQSTFFGEPTVSGYNNYPWDGSQYVAVWDGGSATLNFASPQNYLGLLWGTLGSGDRLTFYDSANNVIGTVTGADVPFTPSGDWGPDGTAYVNIVSATPFSRVVASETATPSFEFDDVAYAMVQEPGSCVLMSAGLFILGFRLRRKSA